MLHSGPGGFGSSGSTAPAAGAGAGSSVPAADRGDDNNNNNNNNNNSSSSSNNNINNIRESYSLLFNGHSNIRYLEIKEENVISAVENVASSFFPKHSFHVEKYSRLSPFGNSGIGNFFTTIGKDTETSWKSHFPQQLTAFYKLPSTKSSLCFTVRERSHSKIAELLNLANDLGTLDADHLEYLNFEHSTSKGPAVNVTIDEEHNLVFFNALCVRSFKFLRSKANTSSWGDYFVFYLRQTLKDHVPKTAEEIHFQVTPMRNLFKRL